MVRKSPAQHRNLKISAPQERHTLWTPKLIMYHKPKGILVTRHDEQQRTTVYDALPLFLRLDGWVPIGRLDRLSRGLLLFTQVGDLVELLTKPGQCEKAYEITIRGRISNKHLTDILKGVPTAYGILKVHHVIKLREIGPKTYLQVTLREGKNRHIRRLFHALKDPQFQTPLKVLDLKRVRIGALQLNIPAGHWRFVTADEEARILRSLKYQKKGVKHHSRVSSLRLFNFCPRISQ